MMNEKELAIQRAVSDVNTSSFISLQKAADSYSIPRSTLRSRISGRQQRATAHLNQQRLTPEQEEFLVGLILKEDSRAQPPLHPRVTNRNLNSSYECEPQVS